MTTPGATYRLQLNRDFTFADAEALVPYLDDLGISHAYLSPILMAQPGSTHGYDTIDHTRINPELGSLDDFRQLAWALNRRGMGVVLDIVPNHMGIGGAGNRLWLDVLKHGPASSYADWFEIDWHPARASMDGKLLVPFLGASYAEALAAGDLRLDRDEDGFSVWAYGKEKLPIRPEDGNGLLSRYGSAEAAIAALNAPGPDGDGTLLDALIASQHWRLAHFSVAADEINYRRFFINSELAGIRIDRPEVFAHAHGLIFSLIAEGLVDGLRIDHIDGLLDPRAYLETLQAKAPRPIYLVVEKILAPHEPLPARWPVAGTTGYEVGAQLTRLLVRGDAEAAVTASYDRFIGEASDPDSEGYRCRIRVMDNELSAELDGLADSFARIAWSARSTGDLTRSGLRRALRETIAHLRVYRTYADGSGMSSRDRREIGRAIARARRTAPQIQPACFDFVGMLLCGSADGYDGAAISRAIGRLQQLAGPVMAKGIEDTALYRYNRLMALNEVGADPGRFSISIAAFHDSNRRRLAMHPDSMIGTSTHDTKRGEDCRAMIAAITDEPGLWTDAVEDWRTLLQADGAGDIHANDLNLLFQLLLGGWPVFAEADALGGQAEGRSREVAARSSPAQRLGRYQLALRSGDGGIRRPGAGQQGVSRQLSQRPAAATDHRATQEPDTGCAQTHHPGGSRHLSRRRGLGAKLHGSRQPPGHRFSCSVAPAVRPPAGSRRQACPDPGPVETAPRQPAALRQR